MPANHDLKMAVRFQRRRSDDRDGVARSTPRDLRHADTSGEGSFSSLDIPYSTLGLFTVTSAQEQQTAATCGIGPKQSAISMLDY
jgi:hypothetical protein